jgi:hypothetical protein
VVAVDDLLFFSLLVVLMVVLVVELVEMVDLYGLQSKIGTLREQ